MTGCGTSRGGEDTVRPEAGLITRLSSARRLEESLSEVTRTAFSLTVIRAARRDEGVDWKASASIERAEYARTSARAATNTRLARKQEATTHASAPLLPPGSTIDSPAIRIVTHSTIVMHSSTARHRLQPSCIRPYTVRCEALHRACAASASMMCRSRACRRSPRAVSVTAACCSAAWSS
jgi:hypothetical protein